MKIKIIYKNNIAKMYTTSTDVIALLKENKNKWLIIDDVAAINTEEVIHVEQY